ncbi:MAG: cytochrome C [Bryobacteraceae bacterium]
MRIKRRTKRFFKRVLLAIPILLLCAFLYLLLRRPASQAPSKIVVKGMPRRLERGEYLFTTLLDCEGCHSERDFSRLGGPVVAGTRGKGAMIPLEGLPGQVNASNITPDKETGVGGWTDGEKIRAIREGISKDGHMLFPLMPYSSYRYMSDADVQAVVAYMNTLPAIRNYVPRSNITFPASMMMKGVPAPVTRAIPPVDPDGGEIYGEYVVTIAGCEECHTRQRMGQADASMRFAGGRVFAMPQGSVISPNITPDKDTGIGNWAFIRFRDRMHSFRQYKDTELPKVGPERFTLMPFIAYANLTDHDLEAMFLYLRSRRPITNFVVPHPGHSEVKD